MFIANSLFLLTKNKRYFNIKTHPRWGRVGGEDMNEERKKALQALKIAKGQTEGIIKMIEDERYCMDISNQMLAVQSLLKKANLLILKNHLNHCVKEACHTENADEKIDEIISIFEKMLNK